MHLLDGKVLKQAVRDAASKNPDLSNEAILFFHSKDFQDLCARNEIDGELIQNSVKEMSGFPSVSRRKISNEIARVIDAEFKRSKNN